jgi:hypothetical protein
MRGAAVAKPGKQNNVSSSNSGHDCQNPVFQNPFVVSLSNHAVGDVVSDCMRAHGLLRKGWFDASTGSALTTNGFPGHQEHGLN